ncbi:ATP-binding cassette domain-containing protein [Streptomyces sp. NPDC051582]|uniref:ABC transporter ATP-binding protein n=1 Tax=Streptomyces sp. NPDC051582 TaxID=3155167 RepID=UPI003442AF24
MYAMVAPPDNAPPDNDVLWARSVHYSHSGSPGLIGVSVGVRQGEVLALTGPRGSGKTTLLRCLSGHLVPEQGEIWFNSVPVHTMGAVARERLRRDRFGWIGPDPLLLPELKVWENAALPLLVSGASHRTAKAVACEWLDRLDIGAFARKRPGALTRAESQRVALARALVKEPSVVFADEPTAPLHRAERALLLRTLTTAARSHGITVLLATHDEESAAVADRSVALLDGRPAATAAAAAVGGAGDVGGAGGPSDETPEGQAACSLSA